MSWEGVGGGGLSKKRRGGHLKKRGRRRDGVPILEQEEGAASLGRRRRGKWGSRADLGRMGGPSMEEGGGSIPEGEEGGSWEAMGYATMLTRVGSHGYELTGITSSQLPPSFFRPFNNCLLVF